MRTHLLCDKSFLGTHPTHIYSPQTSNPQQTEALITLKSNLVIEWVFIGVTEIWMKKQEWLRELYHQSPSQHRSQITELGTWSSLHSLQTDQWVGDRRGQMADGRQWRGKRPGWVKAVSSHLSQALIVIMWLSICWLLYVPQFPYLQREVNYCSWPHWSGTQISASVVSRDAFSCSR